jgi:hypothetical protein
MSSRIISISVWKGGRAVVPRIVIITTIVEVMKKGIEKIHKQEV